MATSILVGTAADTDPPQGMAQTPLGPGDSSDSASDAEGDGTLDEDRAQTVRGDGLMEAVDGTSTVEDEDADPVGNPSSKGGEGTPAAFDDA